MKPITKITANPIGIRDYINQLPNYSGFFTTLFIRDLKVKYVQTRFGWLWTFSQPLLILLVFTVLFNQLIPLDTGSIAYPLFAFSGISIWYLFNNISQAIGNSLHSNQDLMRKIHFPRILLPVAKGLSSGVESMSNFLILLVLAIYYNSSIELSFGILLVGFLYTIMISLLIGLLICTLTIRKRDFQHIITPIINTAIWLTPVFYPTNIIPSKFMNVYYVMNPVAGALGIFRSGLFNEEWSWWYLSSSPIVIIGLIIILMAFIKKEKNILDNL